MDKQLNRSPETTHRQLPPRAEYPRADSFEQYFAVLLQRALDTIRINGQPLRNWVAVPIYPDMRLLGMPGVGGYFNTATGEIGISPLVMMRGNINEIATVIIHELFHGGAFTEGVPLLDEPLCQLSVIRLMRRNGMQAVPTGYDPLVLELDAAIQNMSDERLAELAQQPDALEQLQNWVVEIALQDSLKSLDLKRLTQAELQREIEYKWRLIMKLFPRLANTVDQGDQVANPFAESELNIQKLLTEKFWLKLGEFVCEQGLDKLIYEQLTQQELNKGAELEVAKVLAVKRLHDEYWYIYAALENRLESPERVVVELAA